MEAVILRGPRDLRVEEVSEPRLEDGEVLIEPHVVGICGSDIQRYRGHQKISYPLILGHECCGHIVRLGKGVSGFETGQRVVIQPNFGCGSCYWCRMGRENLCPSRVSLAANVDGCFAGYVKAPARYVWPIPEDMTDEQGALVEPLAVTVRAVGRIGEPLGRRVMILGAGPIGLLVLHVAKRAGATVWLVDLIEERLALGRELGADGVIDASRDDPRQSADGQGIDVVVEAAGTAKTFEQAIEIVRPGGRIVLIGLTADVANIASERIMRKEIEIFGSFIYSYEDFYRAIQLISEGRLKVAPLISHRFPLRDIGEAFDVADKGQGIKVMINLRKEKS